MLASASYDHTVKLWDIATGTCLATIDSGTSPAQLAFDATGLLYTGVGTFALNNLSLSLSSILAASKPVPGPHPQTLDRKGVGLSEDRAWVTWDSHKVLWLPPVYRPGCSAVMASTVAIGHPSGRVVLLTVSPGHGLLI